MDAGGTTASEEAPATTITIINTTAINALAIVTKLAAPSERPSQHEFCPLQREKPKAERPASICYDLWSHSDEQS